MCYGTAVGAAERKKKERTRQIQSPVNVSKKVTNLIILLVEHYNCQQVSIVRTQKCLSITFGGGRVARKAAGQEGGGQWGGTDEYDGMPEWT